MGMGVKGKTDLDAVRGVLTTWFMSSEFESSDRIMECSRLLLEFWARGPEDLSSGSGDRRG